MTTVLINKPGDDDSTVGTVLTAEESCASSVSPRSVVEHTASRLRFDLASNQVHPITHIDDMTEEEIHDVWYDKRDYDMIKNKIIPILRKMMRGETVEETDRVSVRGIECRTRKGATIRQNNKKSAAVAVLEEQERQRDENIYDPELIREAFLKITSPCLEAARLYGQIDEAFLLKDLKKCREKYDTSTTKKKKKKKISFVRSSARRKSSRESKKKTIEMAAEASAGVSNAVVRVSV